jgi:hypothetical protein
MGPRSRRNELTGVVFYDDRKVLVAALVEDLIDSDFVSDHQAGHAYQSNLRQHD